MRQTLRVRPMLRARGRRRHPLRWIVGTVLALAVLVFVVFPVYVGWRATHLPRAPITTTPAAWGLTYRNIAFPSRVDHVRLSGWWIPGPRTSDLTVILAHGYGGNRLDASVPGSAVMRALHDMGANVLTFDFRAEGRSAGTLVSIGEFEVRDLLGAIRYAHRTHPAASRKVVLLGFSMGASVALMAGEADPRVNGVIADSPFAALEPYLDANLPVWTHLPAVPFNAVILAIVPILTGIDPAKVDPEAHMRAFGTRPVLLIAGTADHTIPDSNTYALVHAVGPGQNVRTWLVLGAHHVGAFRTDTAGYLAHLHAFLYAIDPAVGLAPSPAAVGMTGTTA